MPPQTDNCNIQEVTPLITPAAVKAKLPLTERAAQVVLSTRQAIRDIIHGRDLHRLVVIVGPCSIHDPEAALEYAHRLKRVADRTPRAPGDCDAHLF
jgi:3-deoxy-7-phosphoheptulonate synthase